MSRNVPFFLVLLLLVTACKPTKKLYERGDYDQAVFNSVERLRKSPNNKRSRETLEVAYPAMVDYLQGEIAQARLAANPLRWERIVRSYELLDRAHDEILRSPAAKRIIPDPLSVTSELTRARRQAAEARYLLGQQALARGEDGDREAAKEAFEHFQAAEGHRPGYKDSQDLAERARFAATLFVEIEPIPLHSQALSLTNEFFQNQIIEYVQSQNFGPFIYLYPSGPAHRQDVQPDHIIRMIFDDFVVGQAYVKEKEVTRTRDSVVIDEVSVGPDSTRKVYGTVKATVFRFEKQVKSSGQLDVRVIDARTGSVISQRKFPGTYVYVDRWGYFNGNEDALTEEDKDFVSKRREGRDPSPQQLFIEFTRPIYSQVTGFVSNYYRRFD